MRRQIQADLKQAMLRKQSSRANVLKSVLSELTYAQKSSQSVSESNGITVLQRMIKKRLDALHQFRQAGRQDLVEQEQSELEIVRSYLPPQMDEQALEVIARQVLSDLQSSAPTQAPLTQKHMGQLMKAMKERVDSTVAPPALVAQVIKKVLSAHQS
jgi:uncharacterized protein YqeY